MSEINNPKVECSESQRPKIYAIAAVALFGVGERLVSPILH